MRVPGIPTHQLGGKLITICWHYHVSTLLIRREIALRCDEVRIHAVKGQLGWCCAGMSPCWDGCSQRKTWLLAEPTPQPFPVAPEVKVKSLFISRESPRAGISSLCLFWGLLNI